MPEQLHSLFADMLQRSPHIYTQATPVPNVVSTSSLLVAGLRRAYQSLSCVISVYTSSQTQSIVLSCFWQLRSALFCVMATV